MVEAFLPHTSQEAFADGVGAFRMNRRLEQLDATVPRHTSEARPTLGIVLTIELFRLVPIGGRFSQRYGPAWHRSASGSRPRGSLCASFRSMTKKAGERSKEQSGGMQARHTPSCSPRDCGETCSTFGLVGMSERSSYTSG
jgi:hypothetical protein